MRLHTIIVAAALLSPVAASASETVTYGYDAKGRLVQVSHSGAVNDGLTTSYAFDHADNRTSVTTTGGSANIIVVPLGGFTVIPLASN